MLQHAPGFSTAVIPGSVTEKSCVAGPVGVFLLQNCGQPAQEANHHIAVCIYLRESGVSLPLGVNSNDHVDLLCQVLAGEGVLLALRPPLVVPEIQERYTRLVNIYDALAGG